VPETDCRTRAILEQMKEDEIRHGKKAKAHGGVDLPGAVKLGMKLMSKVMTASVYRI
jgi:ubiquinone biosynthesis monooxygenase Coq7